ncbi:hypothetical protein HPB51_015225 [Rhipicephalus microplus]|uniref:Uncharacterized protein n=1 Tax=Rhipicephalus microplus TaxID=6941 RepID=A0A9J6EAD0_RHIMP|nr:hypothetical protein HPB51_015225 [Rhipicephalus microplus]
MCNRTHPQSTARHDCILRYLARTPREKEWHVREELHYRTSQGTKIPDLVLSRNGHCMVLDVQVVGTRIDLSEAHEARRRKYLIPDMLMHITSATGARSDPMVSSIIMTYRGTWATESARILLDLGLDG